MKEDKTSFDGTFEELIDIVAPPIKANLITNKKQSKNEVRRDNK